MYKRPGSSHGQDLEVKTALSLICSYFNRPTPASYPFIFIFSYNKEIGKDLVCRKRSLSSIPSVSNFLPSTVTGPAATTSTAASAADEDRADLADPESPHVATEPSEGQLDPHPGPAQPVYDVPRQLSVTRDDGPVVVSLKSPTNFAWNLFLFPYIAITESAARIFFSH